MSERENLNQQARQVSEAFEKATRQIAQEEDASLRELVNELRDRVTVIEHHLSPKAIDAEHETLKAIIGDVLAIAEQVRLVTPLDHFEIVFKAALQVYLASQFGASLKSIDIF